MSTEQKPRFIRMDEVTDDDLDLVVIAIQALTPHQPDASTYDLAAVDRGREILREALARWGRPASVPPADGEEAELVAWSLLQQQVELKAENFARAVLARWGTANSAQVSSSLAVVQAIREEVQNLDGFGGVCKHASVISIIDSYLP